jgi:hypothetical protein
MVGFKMQNGNGFGLGPCLGILDIVI